PLEVDLYIAAFNPPELLKSPSKRRSAELPFWIILRVKHQHADPAHSLGLLCVRSERPRSRRTGNYLDEITPSHGLPQTSKLRRPWPSAMRSHHGFATRGTGVQRSLCGAASLGGRGPKRVNIRHSPLSPERPSYPR